MGDHVDAVIAAAEAFTIGPGQTLIIRVDPRMPPARCRAIMDQLRERLPEVPSLVIAAEQMAVYGPRVYNSTDPEVTDG